MEKIRLKKTAIKACKYYLVVGNIFFAFLVGFVILIYFQGEHIREYCINVPTSEYHHFKVNENNACLIDWWYFVKEPIFGFVLIYLVLFSPIFILRHFLQKKE